MLSRLHARVDWVLSRIEDAAVVLAGIAIIAVMLLVSADAILRYAFRAPLSFQLHLTEYYLLPISMLLALAWGYRNGGTIQIKLLLTVLPERVTNPIVRLCLAAASVYMAALAWRSYLVFIRAWENHEVVVGVIDWPVGWSWIWVPIGCALLSARLMLDAIAPALRTIGAVAHD
jgi:TRAP-type C4-dicarboxylate transport system permease small subunit